MANSQQDLQKLLAIAERFAVKNRFRFNVDKCVALRFGGITKLEVRRAREQDETPWHVDVRLHDRTLARSDDGTVQLRCTPRALPTEDDGSFRYIGYRLSVDGDWRQALEQDAAKAISAAARLRSKGLVGHEESARLWHLLYAAYVLPYLERHGSVASLQDGDMDCLAKAQNHTARVFLNRRRRDNVDGFWLELGWLPMIGRMRSAQLGMWGHVARLGAHRLSRRVADAIQGDLHNPNPWFDQVAATIRTYGIDAAQVAREAKWKVECREKIAEYLTAEWHQRLPGHDRLVIAAAAKRPLLPNTRLDGRSQRERRIIRALRVRAVPVQAELLHLGLCDNDLCQRCDPGAPETVQHLLLECDADKEERRELRRRVKNICAAAGPAGARAWAPWQARDEQYFYSRLLLAEPHPPAESRKLRRSIDEACVQFAVGAWEQGSRPVAAPVQPTSQGPGQVPARHPQALAGPACDLFLCYDQGSALSAVHRGDCRSGDLVRRA